MLILHNLPPVHWAVAGASIGLVTLALLFIANRRLGISTGLDDLCSLARHSAYFSRRAVRDGRTWRLPFVAGLVGGGFISAVTSGGWSPTWDLGLFDERIGLGPAGKLIWMFVGGICIGFGTRLAGGCTSGHGVFGLSNLERPSLVATVAFMTSGVITTALIYRVVFAGQP